MFDIFSPWHLALICVVALLLFGNRLPEIARSAGRAVNEFKGGLRDLQGDLRDAASDEQKRPTGQLRSPGKPTEDDKEHRDHAE
jgi:sec-independent protein translocase protein TatA